MKGYSLSMGWGGVRLHSLMTRYLSVGTLRGLPLAALDAPVDDHGGGPEARHAPRPRVLVVGGPGPLHHRLPLVRPGSRDQIPAL